MALKTAIVIGGLGGIGSEMARQLVVNGFTHIAILDSAENPRIIESIKLSALSASVKDNIMAFKCDTRNREQLDDIFDSICSKFNKLDLVVNASGIFSDKNPSLTMEVNVIGFINVTLATIRVMSKEHGHSGGTLVNIASIHNFFHTKNGVRTLIICPSKTMTGMFLNFTRETMFLKANDDVLKALHNVPGQSALEVAVKIIEVLNRGENGSVWIIEGGTLSEYTDKLSDVSYLTKTFSYYSNNVTQ